MKNTLDLVKVESAMLSVQRNYQSINEQLDIGREPMTDEVIRGMMHGYEYLNWLILKWIDPFEETDEILQLHFRVFSLHSTDAKAESHDYINFTIERFRKRIDGLIETHKRFAGKPFKNSAKVFSLGVSQKQLFIEWNHRTHALLVNHILLSNGRAPFVLDEENAVAFFNPSALLRMRNKEKFLDKHVHIKLLARRIKDFLKEHTNKEYLK